MRQQRGTQKEHYSYPKGEKVLFMYCSKGRTSSFLQTLRGSKSDSCRRRIAYSAGREKKKRAPFTCGQVWKGGRPEAMPTAGPITFFAKEERNRKQRKKHASPQTTPCKRRKATPLKLSRGGRGEGAANAKRLLVGRASQHGLSQLLNTDGGASRISRTLRERVKRKKGPILASLRRVGGRQSPRLLAWEKKDHLHFVARKGKDSI